MRIAGTILGALLLALLLLGLDGTLTLISIILTVFILLYFSRAMQQQADERYYND